MSSLEKSLTTYKNTALDRAAILITLTLVTMLYAMSVTIANVSLPQIKGALSATTDEVALIVTFSIIATAVGTPMTGWLTARFGRRNVLIWSVLGFTISSFLCGTASSLEELVLYRIMQGCVWRAIATSIPSHHRRHLPKRKNWICKCDIRYGVLFSVQYLRQR